MLLKPSYIVHENKLTAYRSRNITISFALGGLLGCIALFIMPFISDIWEINVYIVLFYLFMSIIIIYCFKNLFDNEVKFEISNDGIYVENRFIKWDDICKFYWNYLGGQQGLNHLNFYIVESSNLTKPLEYTYEMDVFLEYKFKNKIFEPFICEILKNQPHIQVGEDYCLCRDYWGKDVPTT